MLLSVGGWGWKLALCRHVAMYRGTHRMKLVGRYNSPVDWSFITMRRASTQPDWHGMALINNYSKTNTKCHIWNVMFTCWYPFTMPPKRVFCIVMSAAREVNQKFYSALFVTCKFFCKIEHLWDSDVLQPHIWGKISRLPTAIHLMMKRSLNKIVEQQNGNASMKVLQTTHFNASFTFCLPPKQPLQKPPPIWA